MKLSTILRIQSVINPTTALLFTHRNMFLESDLKREIRNSKLRTAILSTIQLSGVLTVAMMAPNVLSLLGKKQRRWSDKNMRSAISRLQDKGLVDIGPDGISITEKGARYLLTTTLHIERPTHWDKKWRIVVFDIPERRKRLRNNLRDTLLRIGFVRLQNSVWIYPFDCEELITLLKTDYRIGKDVLYMIVDKLEMDGLIKKRFDLR